MERSLTGLETLSLLRDTVTGVLYSKYSFEFGRQPNRKTHKLCVNYFRGLRYASIAILRRHIGCHGRMWHLALLSASPSHVRHSGTQKADPPDVGPMIDDALSQYEKDNERKNMRAANMIDRSNQSTLDSRKS